MPAAGRGPPPSFASLGDRPPPSRWLVLATPRGCDLRAAGPTVPGHLPRAVASWQAAGAALVGPACPALAGTPVSVVAVPPDCLDPEPERLTGQRGSLQEQRQVEAHHAALPHTSVTLLRPQPATSPRGISARLHLVNRGEFAGASTWRTRSSRDTSRQAMIISENRQRFKIALISARRLFERYRFGRGAIITAAACRRAPRMAMIR
jgi:hypothetical protein